MSPLGGERLTFDELTSDALGLHIFKGFCRERFHEQDMLFCAEVDRFRRRYTISSSSDAGGTNSRKRLQSAGGSGNSSGILEHGAGGGKNGSTLLAGAVEVRRNLMNERTVLALRESASKPRL